MGVHRYYVREAGEIMRITDRLPEDERGAREILEHVFGEIVKFRKLNQEQSFVGDAGQMMGMQNPETCIDG